MKRIHKLGAVSLAVAALAGCAKHTWAPGPGATMPFGQVSGQCKLMAINGQTSGFVAASGSPKFVAAAVGGAALGSAIGNAVRQQNIYNACMEANGFVVADGQAGATPVPVGATINPDDPTVNCRLSDSEPMEMSRSSCQGRGGTF
jgi:hypothetical protein